MEPSKRMVSRFFIDITTKGAGYDFTRKAALRKVANRRGLQIQEVKMKLITRFELAAKNKNELHAMLREAFNELAKSELHSHQRRNALASIENIQREIGSRALSL